MICPNNFCFDVSPRFLFITTLIKSSKNPRIPKPIVTNRRRYVSTVMFENWFVIKMVVTMMESKIIIPPIVGVPDFFWCDFGPSSRMLCPNFNLFKNGINKGERKTVIKNAKIIVYKMTCSNNITSSLSIDQNLYFVLLVEIFYTFLLCTLWQFVDHQNQSPCLR